MNPGDVTLIVQRPRKRVVNGSVTLDWTNPVEHSVPGWEVQGGDTREEHVRASGRVASFTCWGPIGADVNADDRVRFRYAGRDYAGYQVDGDPVPLDDPILGHVVVSLVKREG